MGHLQRFGPRPPRRLVTLIMRTRDMRLVWMIAPYARAFHGWFIATRAARAQVPPARRRCLQRFGPRPPRRLVTLIMRTRDMRLVWMIAPYARAFHGWFIATRAARAQVPPARRRWLRGVLWWPLRPRARLRHNRRPDRCCARSRSEPARRAGSPKRPGRPRPIARNGAWRPRP